MPCYLYLGIKYFVAPREFYSVGKAAKMALLALKVADPWASVTHINREREIERDHSYF